MSLSEIFVIWNTCFPFQQRCLLERLLPGSKWSSLQALFSHRISRQKESYSTGIDCDSLEGRRSPNENLRYVTSHIWHLESIPLQQVIVGGSGVTELVGALKRFSSGVPVTPLNRDIYFKIFISIVFIDSTGVPWRSGALRSSSNPDHSSLRHWLEVGYFERRRGETSTWLKLHYSILEVFVIHLSSNCIDCTWQILLV